MSTLSANTLFHFTRNKDTLINILRTKFYPRYSLEEAVFVSESVKMAFPMVCFCDIPLSQISNHTEVYGKYAIGLKKSWAITKGITPILYTHNSSLICVNFWDNLSKLRTIIQDDDKNLFMDSFYMALFMKPYRGKQLIKNRKKSVVFYDEREWRYIPPKTELVNMTKAGHGFLLFEEDYKEPNISNRNAQYEKYGLEFTPNDINYIIVEKEDEVLDIMRVIRGIKDRHYSYDDVELLATRIISMERIAEDF